MARVLLSPNAREDLDRLIATLSLSRTTRARVFSALRTLEAFPRIGSPLMGRWAGYRFVLGPWRWMILVYEVDDEPDLVAIATIQDARSAKAAASS